MKAQPQKNNPKAAVSVVIGILVAALTFAQCEDSPQKQTENKGTLTTGIPGSIAKSAVTSTTDEPPVNPFLADSPWPMSHRNSYNQASSNWEGPSKKKHVRKVMTEKTDLVNITLAYSAEYPGGERVMWGSSRRVYKVIQKNNDLQIIDDMDKPDLGLLPTITGAYVVLDKDGNFFIPGQGKLLVYGDVDPSDPYSQIELRDSFDIPESSLRGSSEEDAVVGINMTYDGFITFATKLGTVGVISRDGTSFHYLQLGDSEEGEEVSNSIAVDENGGIYVVTEAAMYRVQWNGSSLSVDENDGGWRADYENGAGQQVPGRLGAGSGSTPTLMGTRVNDDRFVVITDAQELMHLVLFWRDEIPADWPGLGPGIDRRIAAQFPVTYGDSDTDFSISEQSVLVRGYGAVVVSNDYGVEVPGSSGNDAIDNIVSGVTVFFSNLPGIAPYGVEKFEWDPARREMDSAWSNPSISCPNGIPTMSAPTGLMYCIGQKWSIWTIEGLDWDNGSSKFRKFMGIGTRFNSFYAATEIGPYKNIVSGSTNGLFEAKK